MKTYNKDNKKPNFNTILNQSPKAINFFDKSIYQPKEQISSTDIVKYFNATMTYESTGEHIVSKKKDHDQEMWDMRTHNDPLCTSLDTQILFNFILDPSFDETNIINLESKITQETDYETKRTLIGSKTVHLKNYPCIKFLRHLLNTGKIKVEITPTAYSEIKHSRFLKNLILGQLKSGELNPLTLLSAQDISISCNRNI